MAKYGPDKVMVVSFTRTAAFKIASQPSRKTGQVINLMSENVGTLHSICYHALGAPRIIETEKEEILRWNEQQPSFQIGCNRAITSVDNVHNETIFNSHIEAGDELLAAVNIKRNKMVDQRFWFPKQRAFYKHWCRFKSENSLFDFTDLIETALKNFIYAPGHPQVIFVDEAQDSTLLQLTLIRSWGQHCEWIVLTGDDDQCIFSWCGASPDAFLDPPIDDSMKIILKQSWRVPQLVLERALRLISKVKYREPKEYSARIDSTTEKTVMGKVRTSTANWRHPDELIPIIKNYIADGKTVMILASCSYMIDPVKKHLRSQGMAFHNPYRKTRADWNPLSPKSNGISASELLASFLSNGIDKPYWNVPQFLTWANFLTVNPNSLKKIVGKKALKVLKQAVEDNAPGLHTTRQVLDQVLCPVAIDRAIARDVIWLEENLKSARKGGFAYPLQVYAKYGISGIEDRPQITIGTIHSVKGSESDCVILFPDISYQAYQQMAKQDERDAIYRTFYVGMTRAREELVLCDPARRGATENPKHFVVL